MKENITVTKEIIPEKIGDLCEKLSKLDCRAYIEQENQRVNARSIMGMIAVNIKKGDNLTVIAEGAEAVDAMKLIKGTLLA